MAEFSKIATNVTDKMCSDALIAKSRADYIQGFHYPPSYVIRDVMRPGPEQEVWRGPDSDRGEFELRLDIEKMRVMLSAALEAINRSKRHDGLGADSGRPDGPPISEDFPMTPQQKSVDAWIRRGLHLEPANIESQAALEKIPQRKLVEVDARQSRNVQHNSLYWSMLQRISDWMDQDDVTPEVLHDFMKIECGAVVLIRLPNGETRKQPGSTAFHRMDQIGFSEFFEKSVKVAYDKLQVPPSVLADLLTPELENASAS